MLAQLQAAEAAHFREQRGTEQLSLQGFEDLLFGEGDLEPEGPTVLQTLAAGVIKDLPGVHHDRVMENLGVLLDAAESGRATRVGSIFTGTDLAWHAFAEFVRSALGAELFAALHLEHTMGVEWVAWKRHYILANHPSLQFLFCDAKDMLQPVGYCALHRAHVPWPHCDVLSLGSSCRDLSSLRGHLWDSSRAVVTGAGSSGSTIQYAMAYIDSHRPALLLLENVVGLFKGFLKNTR